MPRLTAHVGPEVRAAVDELSRHWRLGNADTLRRLVVFGLGGAMKDANEVNAFMAGHRRAAEKFFGRKRTPGERERSSDGDHAPTVTVRLPAAWARRVRAGGGLRAAIEAGLGRL